MKLEKILEVLHCLDCDEHDINITSQSPLFDGATLTQFEVIEDCGCGPSHFFEVSCITYDGDEEHLFHPSDWLGGPVESRKAIAQIQWEDQDCNPAVVKDGLPRVI